MKDNLKNILFAVLPLYFMLNSQCSLPQKSKISILGFSCTLQDSFKIAFSLEEKDIEAVDVPHFSFLLKQSGIDKIVNSRPFNHGLFRDYIEIRIYDYKVIPVNILNVYSSNRKKIPNAPFAYHFNSTQNIYSNEHWIVIDPFKSNKPNDYFTELYEKDVLDALDLIPHCTDWDKNNRIYNTLSLIQIPDSNFSVKFLDKFCKELPHF